MLDKADTRRNSSTRGEQPRSQWTNLFKAATERYLIKKRLKRAHGTSQEVQTFTGAADSAFWFPFELTSWNWLWYLCLKIQILPQQADASEEEEQNAT